MAGSSSVTGYTYWYGKTYPKWLEEKAQRVYNYLCEIWKGTREIDLQEFMRRIYFERLIDRRKYTYRPYDGWIADFKPSPFIRNWIYWWLQWMVFLGFVRMELIVEVQDQVRAVG